jgi:hypothetical protein
MMVELLIGFAFFFLCLVKLFVDDIGKECMNTSSGFFFPFFWGVVFWLRGFFADDIGKRMHDKRFRFFLLGRF